MKISKNLLKKDLIAISKTINKIPTSKEYQKYGNYGLSTIKRYFSSWNEALNQTFGKVNLVRNNNLIQTTCNECNTQIQKPQSRIGPFNFCSRSCACKFNNKKKPKRKLTKKCKICNEFIKSGNTYCPNCIKDGKHLRSGKHFKDRKISEVITSNDANKYNAIRHHARQVTKSRPQVCINCQYDKHVETCHIKDIPFFPLDTKIEEVNHPENLILLCRNCHWELHHGYLNTLKWCG